MRPVASRAVTFDGAAIGEGDPDLATLRLDQRLAGGEHEEDRLHLGVRHQLGRAAAVRLQRELGPREIQVGDAPPPRPACAGVDRDAVLARDDALGGRHPFRDHRRAVLVDSDGQVGMIVRVEHHHRLAVGHRLQGGVHDRLERGIEIARRMQDRDRLARRLVVRRRLDRPQEGGWPIFLDRLEKRRRLFFGQRVRTLLLRGRPFLDGRRILGRRPLLLCAGRRVPLRRGPCRRRPGRGLLLLPGIGVFFPARKGFRRGSGDRIEPGIVGLRSPDQLRGRLGGGRLANFDRVGCKPGRAIWMLAR